MIYFIPAWHRQPKDWAYNVPMVYFDDTSNHLQTMRDSHVPVGLILTDYQPRLSSDLNQFSVAPSKIMSAFDYLQGVERDQSRIFDFRDFPWPTNSYFNFTPFHCFVMNRGSAYAKLTFDNQGLVLFIDFLKNNQISKRLLLDSRGFVSKELIYDDGKAMEEHYLNETGVWRINHHLNDDSVDVNSDQPTFCQHQHYDHLEDLVKEVVEDHLLSNLDHGDRLIVSLDDDSILSPEVFANVPGTVFSISRWHPFDKGLKKLKAFDNLNLVADSQRTSGIISNRLGMDSRPTVVPIFQSQFKLGHSQRLTEQRVAIFNENISTDDLDHLLDIEYERMIKGPDAEAVDIMMYSPNKEQEANNAVQNLKQKHPGEFILKSEKDDQADDPGFDDLVNKYIPVLDITVIRLTSNSDVLKALDKTRIIIDLGEEADDFMEIASVSVGIPQLRKNSTELLADGKNGMICRDWTALQKGLDYYLGSLNHWNQSLANNVEYLNQYSEDNLKSQWQKVLNQGSEN